LLRVRRHRNTNLATPRCRSKLERGDWRMRGAVPVRAATAHRDGFARLDSGPRRRAFIMRLTLALMLGRGRREIACLRSRARRYEAAAVALSVEALLRLYPLPRVCRALGIELRNEALRTEPNVLSLAKHVARVRSAAFRNSMPSARQTRGKGYKRSSAL